MAEVRARLHLCCSVCVAWTAYASDVELGVFDQTSEVIRALAPDHLGDLQLRSHRRGVKVWFGSDVPDKEHYEAQLLSRNYVDGVGGMALEIGFHSEHKDSAANDEVLAKLAGCEADWRAVLGDEPQAATFFGAQNWRRVSETWIEPDLDDPELAFEIAARLVDYLVVIEPSRR